MATRYWVGGNGTWNSSSTTNWSATSGGASGASAPTATDDVVFDTGSGGGATTYYYVSVITGATCQNMSVSRASTILGVIFQTGASGVCSIAITGNFAVLTVNCGFAATSGGNTVELKFTATTSGKTISTVAGAANLSSVTFDGVGGAWSLSSTITISSLDAITLTNGEFNLSSYSIQAGRFISSNSNLRTINFGTSGKLIISGSGSTAFNCATSTNLTVSNASGEDIYMSSASAKTFAGGGKTWPGIWNQGSGALTITGSNTFNGTFEATAPATYLFEAGSTQTFTGSLYFSGTSTNGITINSTVAGSQATLSQAAGLGFSATYVTVKDSNATGGQTWLATNSIDSGSNTGWIIQVASRGSMMMFC